MDDARCLSLAESSFIFFFQAEDGIRDTSVTGVQTCALPICFLTSGNNASALQAKGDICSACDGEGSDVAESAAGATRAIAVMNWSIFFIVVDATSSSRL